MGTTYSKPEPISEKIVVTRKDVTRATHSREEDDNTRSLKPSSSRYCSLCQKLTLGSAPPPYPARERARLLSLADIEDWNETLLSDPKVCNRDDLF